MFDSFEPVPELACSVCGARLTGWQGKDGPCALLRWRQGVASPVDQDLSDEDRGDRAVIDSLRLPREFEIYTPCCGGRFFVTAHCKAPEGVWSTTVLETAANARQRREERRAEFKSRLAWLERAGV